MGRAWSVMAASLFGLATIGWTVTEDAVAASLRSLAGTEWGLAGADKVFIQFRADGKVSGSSGCNRFAGSYSFDGGTLTVGPLSMTRMMCPPAAMAVERRVVYMLKATRRAGATPLVLTLQDANGRAIATLQRRDFD